MSTEPATPEFDPDSWQAPGSEEGPSADEALVVCLAEAVGVSIVSSRR